MNTNFNIGFIATRLQGLDGVSLETAKWTEVLQELGYQCFFFAGVIDRPSDVSFHVPEAFFNTEENQKLNESIYGTFIRSSEITDMLHFRKKFLKEKLYEFIHRFNIQLIIAENVLAIPLHIPLAMALTEVIAETGIFTIGHHHDMYWERSRFLVNAIQDILQASFPPDLPSVKHVVINSMIQKDLAARRGLSSTIIYNVVNFDIPPTPPDEFSGHVREDLGFSKDDILILQPTRVISRKGIEQTLQLMRQIDIPRTHLLITHSSGDEGNDYYNWLMETAEEEKINIHFLSNHLYDHRQYDENGNRLYTLWDIYPHSDLITYPSLYEGFGNAFLEAIYFKKPILVNRYVVYIVDIEPKGFKVVSIDGYLTHKAVNEIQFLLTNKNAYTEMVEHNFNTGKRYFSYTHLRKRLNSILSNV